MKEELIQTYTELKTLLSKLKRIDQDQPTEKFDQPTFGHISVQLGPLVDRLEDQLAQAKDQLELIRDQQLKQVIEHLEERLCTHTDGIMPLDQMLQLYPEADGKLLEYEGKFATMKANDPSYREIEGLVDSLKTTSLRMNYTSLLDEIGRLRSILGCDKRRAKDERIKGFTIMQEYRGDNNKNIECLYSALVSPEPTGKDDDVEKYVEEGVKDRFIAAVTGGQLDTPIRWLASQADLARFVKGMEQYASEIEEKKHYWSKYIRKIFVDANDEPFPYSLKDACPVIVRTDQMDEILSCLKSAV